MPGVSISVRCVNCDWQSELTEGGFAFHSDVEELPDTIGPALCANCRDVISVRRPHTDDRDLGEVPCPRCGQARLTAWPGRDESLLLDEAGKAGRLGSCPRCDGGVEATGLVSLWD